MMKLLAWNWKNVARTGALGVMSCMALAQPALANGDAIAQEVNSDVIAGAREVVLPASAERLMFERDLQRFAGTFAIYSWLPDEDQAAIYRASRDGASMQKVRSMVISKRRMHY